MIICIFIGVVLWLAVGILTTRFAAWFDHDPIEHWENESLAITTIAWPMVWVYIACTCVPRVLGRPNRLIKRLYGIKD